jgi:hypothetical protein
MSDMQIYCKKSYVVYATKRQKIAYKTNSYSSKRAFLGARTANAAANGRSLTRPNEGKIFPKC